MVLTFSMSQQEGTSSTAPLCVKVHAKSGSPGGHHVPPVPVASSPEIWAKPMRTLVTHQQQQSAVACDAAQSAVACVCVIHFVVAGRLLRDCFVFACVCFVLRPSANRGAAVALLNRGANATAMGVKLSDIPWLTAGVKSCDVQDIWAGTNSSSTAGSISYPAVRVHQAVLLRLSSCKTDDTHAATTIDMDNSASARAFDGSGDLNGSVVFSDGLAGIKNYRIPAVVQGMPATYTNVKSIASGSSSSGGGGGGGSGGGSSSGSAPFLVAFAEAREGGDSSASRIATRVSTNNGATWSDVVFAAGAVRLRPTTHNLPAVDCDSSRLSERSVLLLCVLQTNGSVACAKDKFTDCRVGNPAAVWNSATNEVVLLFVVRKFTTNLPFALTDPSIFF